MASVDSLHSTLKVVTRPLDTNHKKAAFKDNEISTHESNFTLWLFIPKGCHMPFLAWALSIHGALILLMCARQICIHAYA